MYTLEGFSLASTLMFPMEPTRLMDLLKVGDEPVETSSMARGGIVYIYCLFCLDLGPI